MPFAASTVCSIAPSLYPTQVRAAVTRNVETPIPNFWKKEIDAETIPGARTPYFHSPQSTASGIERKMMLLNRMMPAWKKHCAIVNTVMFFIARKVTTQQIITIAPEMKYRAFLPSFCVRIGPTMMLNAEPANVAIVITVAITIGLPT